MTKNIFILKPVDLYIKEVYKKAEILNIEKINWKKIFKIVRGLK